MFRSRHCAVLIGAAISLGFSRPSQASLAVSIFQGAAPLVVTDGSPNDLDPNPGSIKFTGTNDGYQFTITATSNSPGSSGGGEIALTGELSATIPTSQFILIVAQDDGFSVPGPGQIQLNTSLSGSLTAAPQIDFLTDSANANSTTPEDTSMSPPPSTPVARFISTSTSAQSVTLSSSNPSKINPPIILSGPYVLSDMVDLTTQAGEGPINLSFSANAETSVPEPTTLALLSSTLIFTLNRRRR